jgi:hypothetical protein
MYQSMTGGRTWIEKDPANAPPSLTAAMSASQSGSVLVIVSAVWSEDESAIIGWTFIDFSLDTGRYDTASVPAVALLPDLTTPVPSPAMSKSLTAYNRNAFGFRLSNGHTRIVYVIQNGVANGQFLQSVAAYGEVWFSDYDGAAWSAPAKVSDPINQDYTHGGTWTGAHAYGAGSVVVYPGHDPLTAYWAPAGAPLGAVPGGSPAWTPVVIDPFSYEYVELVLAQHQDGKTTVVWSYLLPRVRPDAPGAPWQWHLRYRQINLDGTMTAASTVFDMLSFDPASLDPGSTLTPGFQTACQFPLATSPDSFDRMIPMQVLQQGSYQFDVLIPGSGAEPVTWSRQRLPQIPALQDDPRETGLVSFARIRGTDQPLVYAQSLDENSDYKRIYRFDPASPPLLLFEPGELVNAANAEAEPPQLLMNFNNVLSFWEPPPAPPGAMILGTLTGFFPPPGIGGGA